jgi:hypothetical protein
VIAREIRELRKFATIEYLGEFAGHAAGEEAKVGAESQDLQTLEQLHHEQPKK